MTKGKVGCCYQKKEERMLARQNSRYPLTAGHHKGNRLSTEVRTVRYRPAEYQGVSIL